MVALVVRPESATLPESTSLLLDVIRFSLALLVLFGHLSQAPFTVGWPHLMTGANLAVPGFFVLSGFVIRYVTMTRERDAKRYWISRIARMYSVVLPAIAVTLVCGALCLHFDRALMVAATGTKPFQNMGLRLFLNLTFLGQVWGHETVLLQNSPLWSLGYEVPYYVLFGLATFLRGWRRVAALAVVALILGPQILYLLPLWWGGCWLYDLWQWTRVSRTRTLVVAGACFAVVLLLIFPLPFGGVVRIAALPNPVTALTGHAPLRATNFAYGAGLLGFAGLYLALAVSDLIHLEGSQAWKRWVRRTADGTFTLYVMHRPILVLAAALHLYRPDHVADVLLVALGITVLCIALAGPIDTLKDAMRRTLARIFSGRIELPDPPLISAVPVTVT